MCIRDRYYSGFSIDFYSDGSAEYTGLFIHRPDFGTFTGTRGNLPNDERISMGDFLGDSCSISL